MISTLNQISTFILYFLYFSFPFFTLNLNYDFPDTSKLLLLIIVTSLLIFVESLKVAHSKKLTFVNSTYLLPLFLITCFYLLSSFIKSSNIILTLVSASSTSTWITLFLFYLILSEKPENLKTGLLRFSVLGSGVVTVYILLMYFGILPKNVITPGGNLLTTAIFYFTLIIYLVARLAISNSNKKIFLILSLGLASVTLVFQIFHLISDQKPILLPHSYAVSIFSRVAKDPQSLLLGVGPANFISAFTLEKPAAINQTPLWNIIFTSSSSLFTNLTTETGIISGLAYLAIICLSVYLLIKMIFKNQKAKFPQLFSLIILSLILLFFPASTLLLFFFVSQLAASAGINSAKTLNLQKLNFFVYFFPLFSLFLVFFTTYLLLKAYTAEYKYFQSLKAIEDKDLTLAYNLQKQTLSENPFLDKYHLGLSQTSFLLADELLKAKNLTPENSEKIPKLISQSIEEARTAVNLNESSVLAWDNLTKIYFTLISFASGADKWAVEIAKQTIALDPKNPNHYLMLAQIYQKLDIKEEADKNIRFALSLKPDLNLPSNIMPLPESPDKERFP